MKNIKKFLALILSLSLILGLAACGSGSTADEAKPEVTTDSAQQGMFTPGTYTGQGQGIHDLITVEVTVSEDTIESVTITEHTETPGISDTAIEQIPKDIVETQSLGIDTIGGATVSSNGIIDAVIDALEQAGADIEALKQVAVSSGEDSEKESVEKTADVVVVGAGGAGLAAAVSALENDASVIVVEKMPTVGGSTIMAGGQYNAVDDDRQHEIEMRPELIEEAAQYTKDEPLNDLHKELMDILSTQIEEYKTNGNTYIFDSPELHALQAFKGGDSVANLELVYTLTKGAEESVGWLENLGVEFRDEVATVTGALWPRTHQFVKPLVTGPIDAYMEHIEQAGDKAEILMETKAYELIEQDGKIVGVKAEGKDADYTINANSGVVIATGGFARNAEMIKKYDTHWTEYGGLDGLNSTNSVSATGDGIAMAEAVDANLVGMEWIQLLPVGHPETGGMAGNISINAANQLFINSAGERFVAEDARRDVLTIGLLEQPDRVMWILHDAHEYTDENVKNDFNETIGQLVESGVAVKGDTIEELAEQMGVDAAALQATVDQYNKAVAGETADEFGKKLLDQPFDKVPFYASKRVPTIHHTMGGLEINKDTQVLNTNGEVIEGLYAAGEVTGGIHGANRLGGNAIPDTVVFGEIAGEHAALNK